MNTFYKIIIFFITLYSKPAYSQFSIQLMNGFTQNWLNNNPEPLFYEDYEDDTGYSLSSRLSYNFYKKFNIRIGIEYTQKLHSLKRNNDFKPIFKDVKESYFQVPILLNINLISIGPVKIYSGTGYFFSYLLQSIVYGSIPNAFNSTNFLNSRGEVTQNFKITRYKESHKFSYNNPFESGFAFNIDVVYNIKPRWEATLSISYFHSLTCLSKRVNYFQMYTCPSNRTISSLIGVCYFFNK